MLGIHLSSAHISAIEARFCNDKGFNYMGFLNAVQPFVPQELMYVKRQEEIRGINAKGGLPELNPESDLENILLKIKTKVWRFSKKMSLLVFYYIMMLLSIINECVFL